MTDEILSQEWRENHVRAGDKALKHAEWLYANADKLALIEGTEGHELELMTMRLDSACTSAAIAQAHYAAANVRARHQA